MATTCSSPLMIANIRWMIRRDRPQVLGIEYRSFECPWLEEEFDICLRQRNCVGMVDAIGDRVVGFIIYELHRTRYHVLKFVVDPEYRRQGVGRQMAEKLASKLSEDRRTRILIEVRETNLGAQFFWRAVGFRAIAVLRDFYEYTGEDAYLMEYTFRPAVKPSALTPDNCISPLKG